MNSSTELSNKIFQPLEAWAKESIVHYQILLAIGGVLLIGSLILIYVFYKKIGKDDERTNQINLKSAYIMLLVVVLCDIIFPKEYMWQIFFLYKYSFAFIASGIHLAVRYKKDFLD